MTVVARGEVAEVAALMDGEVMSFTVYLSGEIHTDWRDQIRSGATAAGLDVTFTEPVTDHPASDAAGDHLGGTENPFWRDHQSAKVNAIRTRTLIEQSDLVVVRFGEKYKQWNAAFDAGYCAALGKPYVTLHDAEIVHPLKEVDAGAQAWCTTTDQVVEILRYVLEA
ncbi:YtoQ family protein [Dietzia cinnamea]|uniref:YtoQ family protein n=2 Tax=Dietzia cinnamea TaxID=321318 RepID=A0A4R3ZVI8_9ACTN|nr:YtoQ family protein [Dietzia cinnamea]